MQLLNRGVFIADGYLLMVSPLANAWRWLPYQAEGVLTETMTCLVLHYSHQICSVTYWS